MIDDHHGKDSDDLEQVDVVHVEICELPLWVVRTYTTATAQNMNRPRYLAYRCSLTVSTRGLNCSVARPFARCQSERLLEGVKSARSMINDQSQTNLRARSSRMQETSTLACDHWRQILESLINLCGFTATRRLQHQNSTAKPLRANHQRAIIRTTTG